MYETECRCSCWCSLVSRMIWISVGLAGAPPWGVSAPDFAVGRGPWVQTRRNRASRAAPARARRGAGRQVREAGCGELALHLEIEGSAGLRATQSLASRRQSGRARRRRGVWRALAGRGRDGRSGVGTLAPGRCSKRKVRTYSTQHTRKYNPTL